MPRLIELYKLLLTSMCANPFKVFGICTYIDQLGLLSEDKDLLLKDLYRNKPSSTQFSEYYWKTSFVDNAYWWVMNWNGFHERVRFIQHLIHLYERDIKSPPVEFVGDSFEAI